MRHFATKCAKPWISDHFSESRDPSYIGWAMPPDCPTKDCEASPAGYTHWKAAQGRPRTRWSNCISDLARSRLGVEPAELCVISVDREVLRVILGQGFPTGGTRTPKGYPKGYEIEHQGVRRSLGHRAAYISLIEQYISQFFGGTKNALTWQRGTSSKKDWEPLK